jgi:hypothetical protein
MADKTDVDDPSPDREQLEQAALSQQEGRWLDAAAIYDALARQHPHDHRLRANQGNALWLADLPQAGAEAYRQALALDPASSVSLRGLASCLRDLNRWPEALEARQRASTLIPPSSPESAGNRWSTSQLLVGRQRWREAFAAMAERHQPPGATPLQLLQPRLDIETEQGYGDTFQYLRFLADLVQRRHAAGEKRPIHLWVEPNLVELLRQGLAWLPCPPLLHGTSAKAGAKAAEEEEAMDATSDGASDACAARRISLLDLPHHLDVETIQPVGPYLRNPDWPIPSRQGAPGPDHPRQLSVEPLRVGICWAAGHKLDDPFTAREYRKRSLPPMVLWHLLDGLRQRGASVLSLQVGEDAHTASAFGMPLAEPPESIASFLGTARVLQQLDLVVSVDTALAHLAGAMHRPAWILLPWSADPRWLDSGTSTPWYGSLRLFRQPRSGDWYGAIDALLNAFDCEAVHH